MSASQEKKRRREERSEGVEKRQVQRKMSLKAKRKARGITAAVISVVAVVLVVLIVFNSTLFYSGVTAVKVGDYGYKTAEFNYFYKSMVYNTFTSLYSSYGEYTTLFLDPNGDLDEQAYSEDQSWEDYFESETFSRLQQVRALNDAAAAEGWTLTDEARADMNSIISDARSAYVSSGYDSFKKYLAATYGKGMTEKMYTSLLEQEITAEYYSAELLERLSFTPEEMQARYEQEHTEYDLITYYSYYVSGTADEANGIDQDTAMNAAYETATTIANSAHAEDVFADMVYQYAPEDSKETYADPDATRHANVAPSSLSSVYSDWLKAPERTYGETTVIESGNGYYVLLFAGRNDNSFHLKNFRHILVMLEPDAETGEYTSAIVQEGSTRIELIQTEWQADPTEEHFAELANEESDDTGSNTNGGLYEDVVMGQMVPEIENWIFDPARQVGDSDIIYVHSDNYSGYHLVYYAGESDETYQERIATNLLKSDWYDNWLAEREGQYAIKTTLAYKFAK